MVSEPPQPFRVLVVCEANRARSPVAARLLQREAERRGLLDRVEVVDAGMRAVAGEPLLASMARAVEGLRLNLDAHVSKVVDIGPQDDFDLVVTMTEEQRHRLVRMFPRFFDRTFTLREAVRLMTSPQWQPAWDGSPDVVLRMHRLRPVVRPSRDAEDIADPATGGRRLAAEVVGELRQYVARLARALWGPGGPA